MIYVVRHGQTDLNKEGRLQGRQGLPLNEYGVKQAESLRANLKNIRFDHVFSSPQERAIVSAELNCPKADGIACPKIDGYNDRDVISRKGKRRLA